MIGTRSKLILYPKLLGFPYEIWVFHNSMSFRSTFLFQIHYMTILDSYSFVSNIFVFFAMAEYAVVLLLVQKGDKNCNKTGDEKKAVEKNEVNS